MAEMTKAEMQAKIDELEKKLSEKETSNSEDVTEETKRLMEKVKLTIIKVPGVPELCDDYDVTINGKAWLIQRGVEVEVPRYVAEAVALSEKQALNADSMISELTAKNDEKIATI